MMLHPDNFTQAIAAGGVLVLGVGLVFSSLNPDIQNGKLASLNLRRAEQQQALELAQTQAEQQLANQRYEKGCIRVEGNLSEGMKLGSIPPRSLVCNVQGITGATDAHGVVKHLARSTNKALILERFRQ